MRRLKTELEAECCKDGATLEDKGALLTFHYRNVPLELQSSLVSRAKELISGAGFRVGSAHCAVECRPTVDWDKGRAALHILTQVFGTQWFHRYTTTSLGLLDFRFNIIFRLRD